MNGLRSMGEGRNGGIGLLSFLVVWAASISIAWDVYVRGLLYIISHSELLLP